jgi:hypothetical protein
MRIRHVQLDSLAAEWVASQPEGIEHLIDDRVDLEGAADAFARLASGDLDASKILVYLHCRDGQEVQR